MSFFTENEVNELELVLTANVILQREDSGGKTYSVFFGSDVTRGATTQACLSGPHLITRASLPGKSLDLDLSAKRVSQVFENLFFETSDVNVHSVINSVLILRTIK